MTRDDGIVQRFAASAVANAGSPERMALRQRGDSLLRRLERPDADASIHDRHGLLLELARCALDLREATAGAPAPVFHFPLFAGGERALPARHAGPGNRPIPNRPEPAFSAACAAVPPHAATARLDLKRSSPWQTSVPYFSPSNRS